MVPGLATVETLEGAGRASTSLSPAWSRRLIREGVAAALSGDFAAALPARAERYEVVIEFNNPTDAYRAGWYPGAYAHGPRAVAFAHADFAEILRALVFLKV
jgi:D-amino peptidase